ncbi:hypothetical protein AMECASPLE_007930 [Ameca splendens]|uniref:EGF-like domain-containing protein n=1 Tax=Ameca splendens TaxID=208324 RepID=A0ABV0XCX6_9TELE
MMAEHGTPCDPQDATYCMNGGTCYKIPSMDKISCVCSESFKGSRCEQYQLLSYSLDKQDKGLLAAVVILVMLIFVVLAVVIYYVHKMVKQRKPNQQNNGQGYGWVKSTV